MTLKEMKIKTFSLIEEYYPQLNGMAEDEDVLNKINSSINQIQMDLMKYRKISAYADVEITKEDEKTLFLSDLVDDLYQLNVISFDKTTVYELIDENTLVLPDDFEGTFRIYYYKYPKLTKLTFVSEDERKKHDDSYKFELDNLLLEIMPYGIAADLLKMDMISGYGKYFYGHNISFQMS